jgi:hypothetical protein
MALYAATHARIIKHERERESAGQIPFAQVAGAEGKGRSAMYHLPSPLQHRDRETPYLLLCNGKKKEVLEQTHNQIYGPALSSGR